MGKPLSRAEVVRRTEQKAIATAPSQVSLLLMPSAKPRGVTPHPGYKGSITPVAVSEAESIEQLL